MMIIDFLFENFLLLIVTMNVYSFRTFKTKTKIYVDSDFGLEFETPWKLDINEDPNLTSILPLYCSRACRFAPLCCWTYLVSITVERVIRCHLTFSFWIYNFEISFWLYFPIESSPNILLGFLKVSCQNYVYLCIKTFKNPTL